MLNRSKLVIKSLYCRILHRPATYPMAAWGQWHYSYCGICQVHRWSLVDLVIDWLRGYTFGQDPNVEYDVQVLRSQEKE